MSKIVQGGKLSLLPFTHALQKLLILKAFAWCRCFLCLASLLQPAQNNTFHAAAGLGGCGPRGVQEQNLYMHQECSPPQSLSTEEVRTFKTGKETS